MSYNSIAIYIETNLLSPSEDNLLQLETLKEATDKIG